MDEQNGSLCQLPPHGNPQGLGSRHHSGSLPAVPSSFAMYMNTNARGGRSSGGVGCRGMMIAGNRGAQRLQKSAEEQLALIKKQLVRSKAPPNPTPPPQPANGPAPAHGLSVSVGKTSAAAPHVPVSMHHAPGPGPGHSLSVGGDVNPWATGQRDELRLSKGGIQVRKVLCAGGCSPSPTWMCE